MSIGGNSARPGRQKSDSDGLSKFQDASKRRQKESIDPYMAFNFLVEMDGIIRAGFTEMSGLNVETEVETVKEGGLNHYEHKLPKGSKYSNITLKRGIVDASLWEWYNGTIYGKVARTNMSVCLLNNTREIVMRWDFGGAYPIKWNGPSLNATSNSVAFETVELAHNGLLNFYKAG